MSSTEITIAGAPYVRSRDAGRAVHLSPDYVSRLARGAIDGKQINGLWFVSEQSLASFLDAQARAKEIWRAQLSKVRRAEQRRLGHPTAVFA